MTCYDDTIIGDAGELSFAWDRTIMEMHNIGADLNAHVNLDKFQAPSSEVVHLGTSLDLQDRCVPNNARQHCWNLELGHGGLGHLASKAPAFIMLQKEVRRHAQVGACRRCA